MTGVVCTPHPVLIAQRAVVGAECVALRVRRLKLAEDAHPPLARLTQCGDGDGTARGGRRGLVLMHRDRVAVALVATKLGSLEEVRAGRLGHAQQLRPVPNGRGRVRAQRHGAEMVARAAAAEVAEAAGR